MTTTGSRPLANQGSHPPAYTKGPWRVEAGDSVVNIVAGSQAITATCTKAYYEKFDAEDMANARLIAAAPDLLATLKSIATVLIAYRGTTKNDTLWGAFSQIIAAITKAEGASAGPPERSEAVPTPEGGRT